MKEKQIMVVIKEPGKAPVVEPLFENTLEAFQKAVGGYIETYTVATDMTIVCNEEGMLLGLPFNVEALGQCFLGTIIVAGINGDEFSSLKARHVPLILKTLGGDRG